MKRRVVITGVGVVTPFGKGITALERGIASGRPQFSLLSDGAEYDCCPIRHYGLVQSNSDETGEDTSLAGGMLLAAAEEAIAAAGYPKITNRGGLVVGSGIGNIDLAEKTLLDGEDSNTKFLSGFLGGLAFSLAKRFNIQGPVSVLSTGCSSGNYAVARAAEWIASNEADTVMVGGADPRSVIVLGCFNRLGAADPEIIRPFDENRSGTTIAEGAGVLILEAFETALARGITPIVELAGSGWSCDAYNPTAPEPTGIQAKNSMTRALAEASIESQSVSAVFAHGTGTEANDLLEAEMIADLFPEETPVTALKSLIGHSGAGSGAVTAIAAAETIKSRKLPPTANTKKVDPRCRARVTLSASTISNGAVIVNGFSFGGNNCSLVMKPVSQGDK